jgi:hypothetical protein
MTLIIRIFLILRLYLRCEKVSIPISAIYITKADTSGGRLYR